MPGIRVANPLVDWVLNEGWTIAQTSTLAERLGERMLAEGLPVSRLTVFLHSLHPQIVGMRYTWHREAGHAESRPVPHGTLLTDAYRHSPIATVLNGACQRVRRRLDVASPQLDYPILKQFVRAGATDYLALPLIFSDGEVNAFTLVVDRAGGLRQAEIDTIEEMVSALALPLEMQVARRTARTLLDTYLGRHAGERVLKGLMHRGDGDDIHAVIWFCDLRDSTALADSMSRASFLAILNDFFDCTAAAVLEHDGEVLRFIGDAVLAIFPTGVTAAAARGRCCEATHACDTALAAAQDASARLQVLNGRRARRGEAPLRYGLALHMGDVMYGNIGVAGRLEFTVVGAAANEAARLESLCKELDRSPLISGEFRRCFTGKLESLGVHRLRGVAAPEEVFAVPGT
jgi:adenylate cyclase